MKHRVRRDAALTNRTAMSPDQVDTRCITDDSLPWLPFAPYAELASVKLLAADPISTEVVLVWRIPPGIELPRHRLTCAATIYTLQGRWRYREQDWIVGPGSLLIEAAGSPHTPQALPDGTDDAIALVFAKGEVQLLDAADRVIATQDWNSAVNRYRDYCSSRGLEPHPALLGTLHGPQRA
jgi:quercetin dioxygenase-like cupin family protein